MGSIYTMTSEITFNWRNYLRCPICQGDLHDSQPLSCLRCGHDYQSVLNRPILLKYSDANFNSCHFQEDLQQRIRSRTQHHIPEGTEISQWKYFFFKKIFPQLASSDPHWQFLFESIMSIKASIRVGRSLLDIGAGECKYANFFPGSHYVSFDFAQTGSQYDFSKLDLIADASSIPFRSETFDYALNLAVLEHVPDPLLAVSEMARILKKGGECFSIIPLTRPEHMVPFDFFRYTQFGIKTIFTSAGLEIVSLKPSNGSLWTAVYYAYLAAVTSPLIKFGRRSLRGIAESIFFRILLSPLMIYARLTDKNYPNDFPIYYFVHARRI
jgi:ubiquinone/menaquinone biosynthesis C-methylase UbiE